MPWHWCVIIVYITEHIRRFIQLYTWHKCSRTHVCTHTHRPTHCFEVTTKEPSLTSLSPVVSKRRHKDRADEAKGEREGSQRKRAWQLNTYSINVKLNTGMYSGVSRNLYRRVLDSTRAKHVRKILQPHPFLSTTLTNFKPFWGVHY